MMRYFLTAMLVFSAWTTEAQTRQFLGGTNTDLVVQSLMSFDSAKSVINLKLYDTATTKLIYPGRLPYRLARESNGRLYQYIGSGFQLFDNVTGGGGGSTDTTSLSNRINQKVSYVDTPNMLAPYATKANLKDTATLLRSLISSAGSTVDTTSLSNRINQKVSYTDTSSMLLPYATKANLNDTAFVLRGLISASNIDTTSLSNRINLKMNASDSGKFVSSVFRKSGTDSVYVVKGGIAFFSFKDSIGTPGTTIDTTSLSNRIDQRVKYSDTSTMLANYIRSASNGLTKVGQNVGIGGSLSSATTITTTASNTLALTGLQSGSASDSIVVANASTGVLARRAFPSPGIIGSGTTNFLAKFSGTSAITSSRIFDNGSTQIGLGTSSVLISGTQIHMLTDRNWLFYQNSIGISGITSSTDVGGITGGSLDAAPLLLNGVSMGSVGIKITTNPIADLQVNGTTLSTNFASGANAPSIVLGPGAGTGASFTVTGSNNQYRISITTAGTPTANDIVFTATYSGSFAFSGNSNPTFGPVITGTPPTLNTNSASLTGTQAVGMNGTPTTNIMYSNSVPLTTGQTYIWTVTNITK